ncbi:MAG: hydrogenase 4 subunit B, partial [Acidobacteria bacterium]|nr:hydrogenase 4 subunit B [Acidobacteriota bacterium]
MNASTMPALFWTMTAGYAGAALGLAAPSPRAARIVTMAGTLAGAVASLWLACLVLFGAGPLTIDLPAILAPAGGLLFHLDRLGALFLAVIGGVAIPTSVYGFGYTAAYDGHRPQGWIALNTGAFLLSMSLVTCAGSVFTFVLAWELMATSSFFLVVTEHDRPGTLGAGLWYLGMTHMGLLALLGAFFLLGAEGS